MAWRPKPAAPNTLREMFHWVWNQLVDLSEEGGSGGVSDHPSLTDRDLPDQHPTVAITGLDAKQNEQDARLDLLEAGGETAFNAFMYGTATAGSLGTGGVAITNYANGAQIPSGSNIDLSAGTITIPTTGIYEIKGWVIGRQGNNTKEESIFLEVDVDGVQDNAWVFDVATDKTDYRSFIFNLTRSITAGRVLSLRLRATAGMGTFTVENTSFEVKQELSGTGSGISNIQACRVGTDGTLLWSSVSGWSSVRAAEGRYDITFPTAATDAGSQSVVADKNLTGSGDAAIVCSIIDLTATSCRVITKTTGNAYADQPFGLQRVVG